MAEGWTTEEIKNCAWVKGRLREHYGVVVEMRDRYGLWPTVITLRLEEVLERIEVAGIEFLEGHNIPAAIGWGMCKLCIASISSLTEATRTGISREQRLEMLSAWFNGGGGLPWRDEEKPRKNLTHPFLLNEFLSWAIRYLALHKSVDGRVSGDAERLINVAREIQGEPPVKRYS